MTPYRVSVRQQRRNPLEPGGDECLDRRSLSEGEVTAVVEAEPGQDFQGYLVVEQMSLD
jgi:hypothetical protein